MSPTAIAVIVFFCVLSGALLGILLGAALPPQHLSSETQDVVKLGMGLIATMTALVLGLVIASAKSSFDAQTEAIKQTAAEVLLLDRTLSHYGPETKLIREGLRGALAQRLRVTWPEGPLTVRLETPESTPTVERIEDQILALSPSTEAQRSLQARALQLTGEVQQTRWLLFSSAGSSVSPLFLVVVVFWLAVLFGSFGLFAPRNGTVIGVFFVCALSVAASMFLILELDRPFDGMLQVSSAPLRYTLAHLGE